MSIIESVIEAELTRAHGKKLVGHKVTISKHHYDNEGVDIFLLWDDGTWTNLVSNYESDWSDETPGNGFGAFARSGTGEPK